MSGRSFRHELALTLALAGAACGKHAPKPEADPAKVKELAARMASNSPTLGAVRECKPADLAGNTVTMTFRTMLELAGMPLSKEPEMASWINPTALDVPAVTTMLDTTADEVARRQAAAELLAAPYWLLYRVDMVNAPLALRIKELKIGTVGTRIVRYDRVTAQPSCVLVFYFQNTKDKSDWAIPISDRALIDPEVARVLREDLAAQYVKLVPRGAPPSGSASGSGS